MAATDTKACGVCGGGVEVVPVRSQVTDTDVTVVVCMRCDRRTCKTCKRTDATGRAHRCPGCGTPMSFGS